MANTSLNMHGIKRVEIKKTSVSIRERKTDMLKIYAYDNKGERFELNLFAFQDGKISITQTKV